MRQPDTALVMDPDIPRVVFRGNNYAVTTKMVDVATEKLKAGKLRRLTLEKRWGCKITANRSVVACTIWSKCEENDVKNAWIHYGFAISSVLENSSTQCLKPLA